MRPRGTLACLIALLIPGAAAAEGGPPPARVEAKAEILEARAAPGGEDAGAPAPVISAPEAHAVDPAGRQPLDDPLTCLARTVYWEAKGESERAMQAIANVVMNRLGHAGFPDTVCGVVTQGREQGACQFSWWCDGRSDTVREEDRYRVAKEIAARALNGELEDHTGGALYFHHQRLTPDWSADYARTAELGGHLFYRPKGATPGSAAGVRLPLPSLTRLTAGLAPGPRSGTL